MSRHVPPRAVVVSLRVCYVTSQKTAAKEETTLECGLSPELASHLGSVLCSWLENPFSYIKVTVILFFS